MCAFFRRKSVSDEAHFPAPIGIPIVCKADGGEYAPESLDLASQGLAPAPPPITIKAVDEANSTHPCSLRSDESTTPNKQPPFLSRNSRDARAVLTGGAVLA